VKKYSKIGLLFILAGLVVLAFHQHKRAKISPLNLGAPISSVSNRINKTAEVIDWEKAGQVPEGDRDNGDWQLAQKTTWWGKPLDPKEFWKGRIVWNDRKTVLDAERYGRLYPPMPYEDTNLPPYPNDDGIHGGGWAPDSANIFYAYSSKERGFWDRFDRTHPRPPDQIDLEQQQIADGLRGRDIAFVRNRPLADNYPPEAFTTSALFWAYVQDKRAEYQKMLAECGGNTNNVRFQSSLADLQGDLGVDPKYLTESLTPDQIQAANAWKVTYLQRLQTQNVDPSYINAYLQAWNLSSNQVFGSGN
jgi:hypothetical protein